MQRFNFIDLFSGIGGFALGAKLAGWEFQNHFNSDIEPFANRIYKRNFPESIQLGDIKEINGKELKSKYQGEWILTGGFPCQNISSLGDRTGLEGKKSGLWTEMHRVICEIRPQFAIVENVAALASKGLDRVLYDLSQCGYDAEWRVFRATEAGLPHLRARLYVVAYPSQNGLVYSPDATTSCGVVGEIHQTDCSPYRAEVRFDWDQIFTNWTIDGNVGGEPVLLRKVDGLSSGLDKTRWGIEMKRVATLGNSIVPQIAAGIFERLRQQRSERYD
jgi:DNA (cytosine-5)-methyltransferase 1